MVGFDTGLPSRFDCSRLAVLRLAGFLGINFV